MTAPLWGWVVVFSSLAVESSGQPWSQHIPFPIYSNPNQFLDMKPDVQPDDGKFDVRSHNSQHSRLFGTAPEPETQIDTETPNGSPDESEEKPLPEEQREAPPVLGQLTPAQEEALKRDPDNPDHYFAVDESKIYKIKQIWEMLKPIYPVLVAGLTHPNEVHTDSWVPIALHNVLPPLIKLATNDFDLGSLPVPAGYVPTLEPEKPTNKRTLLSGEHRQGQSPEDQYAPAPPPPPVPPPLPKEYESRGVPWRGHVLMPNSFPPTALRRGANGLRVETNPHASVGIYKRRSYRSQ